MWMGYLRKTVHKAKHSKLARGVSVNEQTYHYAKMIWINFTYSTINMDIRRWWVFWNLWGKWMHKFPAYKGTWKINNLFILHPWPEAPDKIKEPGRKGDRQAGRERRKLGGRKVYSKAKARREGGKQGGREGERGVRARSWETNLWPEYQPTVLIKASSSLYHLMSYLLYWNSPINQSLPE